MLYRYATVVAKVYETERVEFCMHIKFTITRENIKSLGKYCIVCLLFLIISEILLLQIRRR